MVDLVGKVLLPIEFSWGTCTHYVVEVNRANTELRNKQQTGNKMNHIFIYILQTRIPQNTYQNMGVSKREVVSWRNETMGTIIPKSKSSKYDR